MLCSISDGAQEPEDLAHSEQEDEDILYEEWKQRRIDDTIVPQRSKYMIPKHNVKQADDALLAERLMQSDVDVYAEIQGMYRTSEQYLNSHEVVAALAKAVGPKLIVEFCVLVLEERKRLEEIQSNDVDPARTSDSRSGHAGRSQRDGNDG